MNELKIIATIKETPKATSILFEIPDSLKEAYNFVAGQFVLVEKEVKAKKYKRAYSITSPVFSNILQITVKHTDTGDFSKYINEQIKPGDRMQVSTPKGKFVLPVNPTHVKNYLGFATGSGIAPIYSMILAVLEAEPNSRFGLVYGNRSPEDTIFKQQLDDLQQAFPQRLLIRYVYSRASVEDSYLGRIDKPLINKVLDEDFKDIKWDKYYICGQEEMKQNLALVLEQRKVLKENIYYELFSKPKKSKQVRIQATLEGEDYEVFAPKETYILDALLDAGIDAPYSCQGGFCVSCVATLTEGQAVMDENKTLTEEELAAGKILTCVARATTDAVKITFD